MGAYRYIRESFQRAYADRTAEYRARLAKWRKQGSVVRTEPTNPQAAHRLGYKARLDYIVARVRVKKGKRSRRRPNQGRKPGRTRKFIEPGQSWRRIGEQRAERKFRNLKLVGSYFAGEDGTDQYFEVVFQNLYWPSQPPVKKTAVKA